MTRSNELFELLRAERAAQPPALARERGWSRLSLDLAANVQPLPIATGPLKAGLWLVPKWMLAGLAMGFVGAAVVAPAPRANVGSVSERRTLALVPSPASTLPAETPSSQPEVERAKAPSSTDARVTPTFGRAVSAPRAASPATFDTELRLISKAKLDLDAHHFGLARASLDEHARLFPTGVFATERDALKVLVTCGQGPKDERLPKEFATNHPGSPLVERLERACTSPFARSAESVDSAATVDFSKLPNGAAQPGERTNEPSAGEQP